MSRSGAPLRRGPGRLSAEESANLPGRLLDAALEVFVERGYGAATMDEIARRAGSSSKTLYGRYSGKAELLQAVVRRMVDRALLGGAESGRAAASHTAPKAYLEDLCVEMCRTSVGEAAGLSRLAFAEGRNFPEFKELHDMGVQRSLSLIAGALEPLFAGGLPAHIPSLAAAAELCMGSATDWARLRAGLSDPPSDDEIRSRVRLALSVFFRGCGLESA